MNKSILLYLTIALMLSGCSKSGEQELFKPDLEIEKDVYEYLNTDFNGVIPVNANVEWSAALLTESDWIEVTKTGDGLLLDMDLNSSVNERVAKVKIQGSADPVSKIIVVKQHGNAPALIVDKAGFNLEAAGGSDLEVNVSSNMVWDIKYNVNWITVVREEDKLKISVQANEQFGPRTAVVTVKGELPVADKNITITQKGTVNFTADKKDLTFARTTAVSQDILVTTNLEWTVDNQNSDWITAVKDGNKLTVSVAQNSFLERIGFIVLKTPNLDIKVTVKQIGHSINTIDLEREVLVKMYNTMGGKNSGTGWDVTQPLNTSTVSVAWPGVKIANVDGRVRVTDINLTGKTLSGPIPQEIGYLTELTGLQLANNNNVSGTIPAAIGALVKLKIFTAQRNKLTGSIPKEFANLTELNLMQIHTNQLSGMLPANVFGQLTKLTSLELRANNLTGEIPADLKANPKWSALNPAANLCPQNAGYGFTNCP